VTRDLKEFGFVKTYDKHENKEEGAREAVKVVDGIRATLMDVI
jgi:hypothetical protein